MVGEIIAELVIGLIGQGFSHSVGAIYIWVKNKGKRSYYEIRNEEKHLSLVAGELIWKTVAIILIIGIILILGGSIYNSITFK